LEITFWILLGIVVYTFAGYAILVTVLVLLKRSFGLGRKSMTTKYNELPLVCLFVTAYNEKDYVEAKVQNMLSLNYPADKIIQNGVIFHLLIKISTDGKKLTGSPYR
jgi:cellulose synthase/poly-beta-1,6-N-acetylglucosamine synthase-like glycosyltransferase